MIYLLPFLAVLIGAALAFTLAKKMNYLPLLLSFSGAFLLAITVVNIIPKIYRPDSGRIGIFILIGILLQLILEYLSGGAEHGHLHHQKSNRFPWLLFISISVHALLEGFPLHLDEHLLVAIMVHKVPIGLILTSFLLKVDFKPIRILPIIGLFALMTPLGSFLEERIPVSADTAQYITAVAIGVFLHVSTTILFETSRDHRFNLSKFLMIILGFGLALIT
ncbi:MAG: ZIP family metal transporter [Psychroflexus sp.]|nr:ZIP family metal transporter [Psychroflexus sp.]